MSLWQIIKVAAAFAAMMWCSPVVDKLPEYFNYHVVFLVANAIIFLLTIFYRVDGDEYVKYGSAARASPPQRSEEEVATVVEDKQKVSVSVPVKRDDAAAAAKQIRTTSFQRRQSKAVRRGRLAVADNGELINGALDERLQSECLSQTDCNPKQKHMIDEAIKDRIVADRVIMEARDRAFLKAQERAKRASAERAAAEACMAEARERASVDALKRAKRASAERERAAAAEARKRAAVERARAERAKALADEAERNRLAEYLDADIKRWAAGKEGDLPALLLTLQHILGPGWKPVTPTEIVTTAGVKKAYRKATLCVHPDKLQQRGADIQQKYICEKVFDLLKEAWDIFNSEES